MCVCAPLRKCPAAVCLALVIVCMCELVQCQPLFYRSLGDSALGLWCLLKGRLCVMNSLQQCTVGMQVAWDTHINVRFHPIERLDVLAVHLRSLKLCVKVSGVQAQ